MSLTVTQMIKAAMRVARVLDKGETPDADEMNEALESLTIMLHSWAARSLVVRALVEEGFALTAGTADYTIGVGGAFNTTKPLAVLGAFVRDSNNYDTGVDIITETEYDSYQDKKVSTARPNSLYYNPGLAQQSAQKGTISVYPIPDSSTTYTLYVSSRKPFTDLTTLTETLTFEPPYEEAIKYELAVRLWGEYHKTAVPNDLHIMANEAVHVVETMNSKQYTMITDLPRSPARGYNIYTGEYGD